MAKNLVIVESPAKAKTIEGFLGKDYKVMSSQGHIRDLHKKNLSIDVEGDFSPIYEIPDDKKALVSELKKAAKAADVVWLASDEDREGEAIAWHLYEVLGLKGKETRRIVFHEITKDAILNAIEHPREIDLNLVDAQQARRVLDRIVGFELSPVLWKKIKPSLSAGRVQSVAVRLIVDREQEIKEFKPERYYRIVAVFTTTDGDEIRAELSHRIGDEETARAFLESCKGATYTVRDVQVRPVKKSPAPPFTTSTLQQEASRKLGFGVAQTMRVAQRLYEAGHITYMRTDSLNLSAMAINTISKEIKAHDGEAYLHVRRYHTSSKGAQEAHEAIRPTYINKETIDGTPQEKRLYTLIRKRTLASQMSDAVIEKTTVEIGIDGRDEHFTCTGEVVKFDGFLRVYTEGHDDEPIDGESQGTLPVLHNGEALTAGDIVATERFTQLPPRYNEAMLVRKMEELGIGRPSTYAPTISTIQQREYVERGDKPGVTRPYTVLTLKNNRITTKTLKETTGSEKGKLIPTDIGIVVNEFLTKYFSDIVNYNFTADVEKDFDEIAAGHKAWNTQMRGFYDTFMPGVREALDMRLEHKVGERLLGTDPASGKPVFVKIGRFGPLVQIGDGDKQNKPQFASLQKGQSVQSITLEEALKLFEFPRTLGTFEGHDVTVAVGRFGPYVKHDGKFVSIPKDQSPTALTLEEAEALITAKRQEEAKRIVKTFSEDPDIQILNGRYGIYIAASGQNYKIPKGEPDPSTMSLERAREIIASQADKPRRGRKQ